MIRSANTGYSVAVDSRGILLGRIGSGRYGEGRTDGTLIATLPTDARTTLYGRIGDAWGWAMLAATAVLAIVRRGRPAATEEST